MRILAIRGCNLASLAGEFEIDLANGPLAEAGVFAIVGNTGAGKSTLLDALCAALFDRTPRLTNHSRVIIGRGDDDPAALGAQDVRTILRRGASTGWAEVDFESRDERRYRARWSVRRARGQTDGNLQDQQVTLTSIDGSEHLGGTKTETLKAIHARLGLTFDQFRRSALLAQGEFAAFLRADGRDRSELLERMTGTEIYSKLSIAAHLRATLAEQQLRDGWSAAFAIAVLDDAARETAERELVIARAAKQAARARLAAAEAAARWHAEATQRDDALASADRDRIAAERAAELAAPERAELALRRRADTVRAVWDDAERLERRLAIVTGEVAAATAEVGRAELARRDVAATAERLRAAHEPVRAARLAAGLVERPAAATNAEARARAAAADSAWLLARAKLAPELASWLELDAKFAQHESVVEAIASTDRAMRGHVEHHAKIRHTRDTTAAEHQQASARLGDAQRHAASYAQRRGPTLDAARRHEDEARLRCGEVDRLVAIAEGARDAAQARTEIDRQLAEQAAAMATDATNRVAAEAARQIAAAVREERARAVTDLRNAAGYEHARAELVDGESCPLCGATEHPWRDRGAFDDIIRDAEARLAEVIAKIDATTHTIATITARTAAREAERNRLVSARAVAEASATSAVPTWREQLSALGELMLVDDPATTAAQVLAADRQGAATASLEEARSIRSQAEAATKAAADAQAQIQTWQSNVELVDGKLRDLDRKLADIDATIGKLRAEREVRVGHQRALATELDAAFARWNAIASELHGGTLDARRVAMAAVAKMWHLRATAVVEADGSVQAALALVEHTAREVERAAAEHVARRDEAVRHQGDLANERAVTQGRLDTARAASGFDVDELRRLLAADPDRADQLAERLAELDRAVERARAVVAERRRLIADHQTTRPLSLDDAGQVAALAVFAADADHHVAKLEAALAADGDAQLRRATALTELARVEAAGDTDRVLGEVIGSHDGKLFRSFAQSLTLDSLLAVANSHLEELAPRYQLERVPRHDLELQVVDRDLGAEVRSVQSLSGGESFLVSLALALGLSSMSAHDVRVRTLLIDEGFGTLDPATLDTALSVLDALQATGRQVGVISHVPALVERVGAHVAVIQRGGGRSEVIVA